MHRSLLATLCLLALPALAQDSINMTPPASNGLNSAPNSDGTFQNPLIDHDGADPCLIYFEGAYYLTVTNDHGIYMRTAKHLAELKTAADREVWSDLDKSRFRDMWAPECHLLPDADGQPRWYLYYTAADGVEPNHRMYVLESEGPTPFGPYHFKAQLLTDPKNEYFAIDGTALRLPDGRLYFIWCGRPSTTGQGLFISLMENPWTLKGRRVALDVDGFGSPGIREGPVTLVHGDKVFLVYSANDTGQPDYMLGWTAADVGADLLETSAWKQQQTPAFTKAPQNGVFGPGHCFFLPSPDGTEDWMVYHAKTVDHYTYKGRTTRAQPFTWNADGTPNLGVPVPLHTPVRVPSGD